MILVESHKNELWAESHLVARKFGMKHQDFINTADKIIRKLEKLRGDAVTPKYYKEMRHYRGTDFGVYMMNRQFFSLVSMRLTSKKAFEWQVRFNDAFYEMEKQIIQTQTNKSDIEWTSNRLIGKTARLEETDVIKQFIEYATEQGSKNAKNYYGHITNATYKALGLMAQKHPKIRDQMSIYEVSELMLAERLAKNALLKYMEIGREYHDIYDSVKNDLLVFADSMKLTNQG